MKKAIQNLLRSSGYEVVPYPPNDWVRCRDILRHILEKLSINCVLDVGANRGQYGSTLRDIGYRGWIISFEPVRANFEALSSAAAQDGSWRAFAYALGASAGQAEINVMDSDVFSSFLNPIEDSKTRFPRNAVERKEVVNVRRLDDVFEECIHGIASPRIYLKMDTQGFDLEVLNGSEKILPVIRGLQTEVSFRAIYHGMEPFSETLEAFKSRGFDVVDFMPVTRDLDGLCAIEMDCVMARRPHWSPTAGGDNVERDSV